jgi:hypothetical protein
VDRQRAGGQGQRGESGGTLQSRGATDESARLTRPRERVARRDAGDAAAQPRARGLHPARERGMYPEERMIVLSCEKHCIRARQIMSRSRFFRNQGCKRLQVHVRHSLLAEIRHFL